MTVVKTGFFQALGVAVYCFLVGSFMWNAGKLFGQKQSFLAPIALLTLFSTSALICGLIVFYKPYKLFFAGKKNEAIEVVASTALYLFLFVIAFFTTLFLSR